MQDKHILTLDKARYPQEKTISFIQEQLQKGRLVIPIIDPGVSIKADLPAYFEGYSSNVFMRSPSFQEYYQGHVWPGPVHFIDFLTDNAKDYWTHQLAGFKELIPYSGLWLDMCEPADFGVGHKNQRPNLPHPPHYNLNYPPYAINNAMAEEPIFFKSITMDARHADGHHHLGYHNVYGLAESFRTAQAMEAIEPGKRHLILTRSTFPGSGRFTAHWLGDNFSDFENIKYSIAGLFEFQLFGIPMVGPDICGFLGTADGELCTRWMALGAFYPFARNHNAERPENAPQEPYQWASTIEVTKKYFLFRYSILPYWYTLMRMAHDWGSPMIRPMFFEYPSVKELYEMEEQFMVGPALLVIPVLRRNSYTVQGILPEGVWYDPLDIGSSPIIASSLRKITFHADIYTIPVLLRGGYILLRHYPELTIRSTMNNDLFLLVALDGNNTAQTEYYFDDGISSQPATYTKVNIRVNCVSDSCMLSISGDFEYEVKPVIREVTILSSRPWPHRHHQSPNCLHYADLNLSLNGPREHMFYY